MLVNVRGDAMEKLTVASFEENTSGTGALAFTARFKNDGELYEKPQSTIKVQNILGQTVAEAAVQPENILPGYIRRFTQIIPSTLWPGPYKATLKATYGEKAQTAEAKKLIWIEPKATPATAALASIAITLLATLSWTLLRHKKSPTN
jgi:hypothetical protein